MKWIWLLLILFGAPCPLIAQNSSELSHCLQNAMTQLKMNECASEEAKSADAELNRVYQQLLSIEKSDSVAMAKIKKAEKIWIAYRDAYIEATYPDEHKQASYGSMYPMETGLLYAKLTRQHTEALKAIIQAKTQE